MSSNYYSHVAFTVPLATDAERAWFRAWVDDYAHGDPEQDVWPHESDDEWHEPHFQCAYLDADNRLVSNTTDKAATAALIHGDVDVDQVAWFVCRFLSTFDRRDTVSFGVGFHAYPDTTLDGFGGAWVVCRAGVETWFQPRDWAREYVESGKTTFEPRVFDYRNGLEKLRDAVDVPSES